MGEGRASRLEIAPLGGFGDDAVLDMLHDIQAKARRLLHQPTIDAIGRARAATLGELGGTTPSVEAFAEVSATWLRAEIDVG